MATTASVTESVLLSSGSNKVFSSVGALLLPIAKELQNPSCISGSVALLARSDES